MNFVVDDVNKDSGTSPKCFLAIIAACILYALPAWGCFLSKELSGRIDAYLKRCYRYGFSSKTECVDTLFDTTCMELFNKMRSSGHCLHDILLSVSNQSYDMRQHAHRFVLPQCNSMHRNKSFGNYCLFKEL